MTNFDIFSNAMITGAGFTVGVIMGCMIFFVILSIIAVIAGFIKIIRKGDKND